MKSPDVCYSLEKWRGVSKYLNKNNIMKNISIKTKILLLTIIPLIIVSIVIIYIAVDQAKALGDKNIDSFSTKIFDLRRIELENYTNIAVSAVEHITKNNPKADIQAQEEVKDIIRNMRFGSDGYFYAYDRYVNLAHPTVSKLEGTDQTNLTDPNGVKIIQELYQRASIGGGFTDYVWLKPSRGREVEKIGYSKALDGWEWWIGTGLYVDDLEDAVEKLQSSVDENIEKTLQIIILLACAAVVVVGLICARFTLSEGRLADEKLQELSRKSVDSQESERSRVARQLQSSVVQALTVAKAKLRDVAKENEFSQGKPREDFVLAAKAINHAIQEVRGISGELRPESLDTHGLDAAIDQLVMEQKESSNVHISYKSINTEKRIDPEIEIVIYRIVQAALSNIVQHSNASSSTIHLSVQKSKILLSIQDNGIGFNVKDVMRKGNKAGIGLIDMRVRAESLGGSFAIFSTAKIGTHVKIEIPV